MVQPNGESQKAAGKKEALPKPISGKVPQGCKPRSDQAQQAPGSEKNGQPALETVLPMVFENRVENLVDGGVSHSAMHLIVKPRTCLRVRTRRAGASIRTSTPSTFHKALQERRV